MTRDYVYVIESEFPELWVSFTPSGALYRCDVTPPDQPGCCIPGFARTFEDPPEEIRDAIDQIAAFLGGKRSTFSLRFLERGTDFQKQVWRAARNIPYGETLTYQELAADIGRRESVRAVGRALGSNSLLIITPCHRIIPSRGGIGGYRGGRGMKKRLLALEAAHRRQTPPLRS